MERNDSGLGQTFLAKVYGVSRMDIMHLFQLGVLTPLITLDRHWKSLLLTYRARCQVSHALTYVLLLIMGILALLTKAGFVIPVLWSLFAGLINGTVAY